MPTALSLRRDAELKYDGPIPAEVLAAIAAEEQRERDAQLMAPMTEPQRLRFRAAKEFRLAKRSFRLLCAMTRRQTVRRPDAAWFALRDRARMEAEAHVEAWRMLRWREGKVVR
ncbi:hypothetical protein [Dongia sp. agr-C8]